MAEFIEINTYCDVLQVDGDYIDAAIAEMLIEVEGEQVYLVATWDGWSTAYAANDQSQFDLVINTDLTDEERDELDLIRQGEYEDYLGDDEAILDSVYAKGYKQLAEVLKAKLVEVELESEESVNSMPFWPK